MDATILGLVGLGGLYTIANQEKREEEKKRKKSIPRPKGIDTSLVDTKAAERKYPTVKQASKKYNTQEQFKKEVRFDIPEPRKNDFTHNNMVPFFGGKIRGR